MKVRIGNLEITDVTPDELDNLIKRYGGDVPKTQPRSASKDHLDKPQELPAGARPTIAADAVLLEKLAKAGATGMTTDDIGTILGRRGKAAKKALDAWSRRVGLTTDENMDAFEFARVGTRRGWRIKTSLLDVANHLMAQH